MLVSTPSAASCVLATGASCYFDTWLNITAAVANSCHDCGSAAAGVNSSRQSLVNTENANSPGALISADRQVGGRRPRDSASPHALISLMADTCGFTKTAPFVSKSEETAVSASDLESASTHVRLNHSRPHTVYRNNHRPQEYSRAESSFYCLFLVIVASLLC